MAAQAFLCCASACSWRHERNESHKVRENLQMLRSSQRKYRSMVEDAATRPRFAPHLLSQRQGLHAQSQRAIDLDQARTTILSVSPPIYGRASSQPDRTTAYRLRSPPVTDWTSHPQRARAFQPAAVRPLKTDAVSQQPMSPYRRPHRTPVNDSWSAISFAPPPPQDELSSTANEMNPSDSTTLDHASGQSRHRESRASSVTLHLDGSALGRWAVDHLGRILSRPAAGMTGVDPRASIPRGRVSPF
jgi:hypothetical protein